MSEQATTPSTGTGAAPSSGSAPSSSNARPASNFAKNFMRESNSREDSSEVETPAAPPAKPIFGKASLNENNLPQMDSEEESEEEAPEELSDASEESEEDFSWVKDFKNLHGLELKDLLTALQAGTLPDELHDIIKIKLKNGEDEWESPLSKARKEAMLHQDYTRKTQAFNKEREEYNADKNEFIEMLQTWKSSPEAFLSGMERLEFPILDAAKMLAKRMRELDEMSPRERELYEGKQKTDRELAQMKQEQARSLKQQTSKQQQDSVKRAVDNVSSTAKSLFDKNQIPVDDKTWNRFLHNFEIVSSGYGPDKWSPDMIEQAFDATAADYQQALAKRSTQQQAANPPKTKQQFDSPAREAVAQLKAQNAAPARKPKGGPVRGSEFMKNLLGKK